MASPIESLIAPYLYDAAREHDWRVREQVPVGKYFADFLIETPEAGVIVVECDGHDFHERTKEQAAHDRRRDRFMIANRITPVRFTGSEIYRDASGCVAELIEIVVEMQRDHDSDFHRGLDLGFSRGVQHAVDALSVDLDKPER